MTIKHRGLGRNLSILLGQPKDNATSSEPTKTEVIHLPVQSLQPGKYQPRGAMEEEALHNLAESIKKQGLLQPILARALPEGNYEIIAGERRWRASQHAGLTEVPVLLKQVDDETAIAMALVENVQREDLNALDKARAMHRLTTEFGLTHQQIAELLSKSRTAVTNYLRLLSLSTPIKKMLEHGDIDMGHARALLMLEDEQQHQAAQIIIAKNLSVRETEQLVERIKMGKKPNTTPLLQNDAYTEQLNILSTRLQTKVTMKMGKSGKGSLTIHYHDTSRFESLLQALTADWAKGPTESKL